MRNFTLLVILILGISSNCFAQETFDCLSNYKFVYQQLQKSKSYQKLNTKQQSDLDFVYGQTIALITQNGENSIFECISKTAETVMLVNDNHNTFETKSYPIEMKSWEDKAVMTRFEESPEYNAFPFYQNNIDSLYKWAIDKSVEEIEGLYVYGNHTKLLLVEESGFINGYIFETVLKPWRKGELMLRLLPQENGRYKLLFGNPVNKKIIYNIEKFQDGFLMQLKLKKINILHPTYHDEIFDQDTYLLKPLNDTIQYLKIGSFSSSSEGIRKAKAFCDTVQHQLNSEMLIVDLRGNSGGYKSNSMHFDKLLKQYKGNMVFLVNFRTKSYAEIFTIQWKGKPNVTIAGMNTAGAIAFSRNNSEKEVSDDGWISTHFTDMGGILYKKYENVGVEPDLYLDLNIDWIEQIINSPNPLIDILDYPKI